MKLAKNISNPTNFGFSFKKATCSSCGASFDAAREKHCPYCASEYLLRNEDWVVTEIEERL